MNTTISNRLVSKILHQNTQSRHSSDSEVESESSNQKGIEQPINTSTQQKHSRAQSQAKTSITNTQLYWSSVYHIYPKNIHVYETYINDYDIIKPTQNRQYPQGKSSKHDIKKL